MNNRHPPPPGLALLCQALSPKGLGGRYGSQALCIKAMSTRANTRQDGQVGAEQSGLQPHLLLLEARQPLLHLLNPLSLIG